MHFSIIIFNKIKKQLHIYLYLTPILNYAKKTKTLGRHYARNGFYDRKRNLHRKC